MNYVHPAVVPSMTYGVVPRMTYGLLKVKSSSINVLRTNARCARCTLSDRYCCTLSDRLKKRNRLHPNRRTEYENPAANDAAGFSFERHINTTDMDLIG